MYNLMMSDPLMFGARDHEIARLRRRIEALEARIEELAKAASATAKRVDARIDLISDDHGLCLEMLAEDDVDLSHRLRKVETTLFPNLEPDLRRVDKLIGPTKGDGNYTLDRRNPKKPK
jgi:hypothetical protein